METISYPARETWASIVRRPFEDDADVSAAVGEIIEEVRRGGDGAVMAYEARFDKATLRTLVVSDEEKALAAAEVPGELKAAIDLAHKNIQSFHAAQRFVGQEVATSPGVTCWQKSIPIESVGLYVPGGTAPLFSTVLMLATPAVIAGCKNIIMCTPPGSDGRVNPAILYAAVTAGVTNIFKAGGAQAIAAMAYGTESIHKVNKIFGPGNRYVTAAKQHVAAHGVAIDLPAGPSEVCVIADGNADASFVAADLLSQAEHGVDSQVLLITDTPRQAERVEEEVTRQLSALPRKDIAAKSLANSRIVIVHDTDEAMELSNAYAPEHLIIQTDDCARLAEKVTNAGSVFIGRYACESAGDYASGTNHTLPTHGYATCYNGVNLDSFCRKTTFQRITPEGIRSIGKAVEVMASAERLEGHKNAMTLRIEACKKGKR